MASIPIRPSAAQSSPHGGTSDHKTSLQTDDQLNVLIQYCIARPRIQSESNGVLTATYSDDPQDGHAFITINLSTTLPLLEAEILRAFRATNESNNRKPLTKSTIIDSLQVAWGCYRNAPEFPTFSEIGENNVAVILQMLHKRSGYDFIWVELKGDDVGPDLKEKGDEVGTDGKKKGDDVEPDTKKKGNAGGPDVKKNGNDIGLALKKKTKKPS